MRIAGRRPAAVESRRSRRVRSSRCGCVRTPGGSRRTAAIELGWGRRGRSRAPDGAGGGPPGSSASGRVSKDILRKEVIQPQVPLRLPCYDLVPITGFIFGACLAAPATSDAPRFRGLTGGVYKAQEHIHRGSADPRLLAIPASCRRVAACNPNWGAFFAICSALRLGVALSAPL